MNIPKSVPAKLRSKIHKWDDERSEGGSIVVTLVGLCIDGPGKGPGNKNQHVFGEDTVKDAIETMRSAKPCQCEVCSKILTDQKVAAA